MSEREGNSSATDEPGQAAETGCAVIIMTGSEDARHADLGFEVIMKPIDVDGLLAQMQRALAARTP